MKKKVLCMLLVVMLSGAMLAGCGNNNDIPDKEVLAQSDETDTQPQETDEPETQEPTEETTEQPTQLTEEPTVEPTEQPTEEPTEPVEEEPQFTFTDLSATMYAKSSVNVRNQPNTDGEKLGGLSRAQEVAVTGQCNETGWYRISYNSGEAFVSDSYLVYEKPVEEVVQQPQEQASATNECPYELYKWYDEGSYFFLLTQNHEESSDYISNLTALKPYTDSLRERYEGCFVSISGGPSKFGNYAVLIAASYFDENEIPIPIATNNFVCYNPIYD